MNKSLSNRKRVYNVLSYVALIFLAFFFLFPLFFMLMSAFKNDEAQLMQEVSTIQAFLPNSNMGFQNFTDVFARFGGSTGTAPYWRIFLNSSIVVSMIVMLGLIVNSSFAYALARMRFLGRNFLLTVIISLIIIPFQAVTIPLMLMTYQFKMANTYLGLIIPFVGHALSVYLFYQFFIGLPKELEEAAVIDGASRFRIYWNIVLPNSGPVFAVVAIQQFLSQWGNLMWPVMIVQNPDLQTLPVAMQNFFGQYPRNWGDIMAFTLMTTVPTLLMFLFFQRWFVRSAVGSSIKG